MQNKWSAGSATHEQITQLTDVFHQCFLCLFLRTGVLKTNDGAFAKLTSIPSGISKRL